MLILCIFPFPFLFQHDGAVDGALVLVRPFSLHEDHDLFLSFFRQIWCKTACVFPFSHSSPPTKMIKTNDRFTLLFPRPVFSPVVAIVFLLFPLSDGLTEWLFTLIVFFPFLSM